MGVKAATYSTQIVPPEPLTRLLCELTMTAGILANLADDMRNLQRTEIGEVGEEFEADQVGSSTMPQKQNPINFENTKSCWKIVMPRIVTVFLDQISEHQRDLTNSASSRTYGEMVAYVVSMAKRMTKAMKKLNVNEVNLQKNFEMQGDLIVAEPLYLLLARRGHPDAHEKVKQLTLAARKENKTLFELLSTDEELVPYLRQIEEKQQAILANPEAYLGQTVEIAKHAEHLMKLVESYRHRIEIF
jgi:adenylosuccinate lyase